MTARPGAFVPAGLIDDVSAAVRERLAKIVVGAPGDPAVRMGTLASLEQREEVRRSLKALEGAGTIVFGDPEHVDVTGADAVRGAFMSPVLLRAGDPDRAEPHEVEAFGPVSTLLPYTSADEVIGLAARGQGSLAGSVVTGDTAFARDVVLGLAPWHGRLLVLDTEDAGHGRDARRPGARAAPGGLPGRRGADRAATCVDH